MRLVLHFLVIFFIAVLIFGFLFVDRFCFSHSIFSGLFHELRLELHRITHQRIVLLVKLLQ
jgi:hypothetical protein